MSDGSIIIIGAGIAGLSAGCYAQMNGYASRIFELHNLPGGLCTSWQRKGYTIDGCIHWLVGSREGGSFNQIWQELGALQGRRIVDHEEFVRVEGSEGKEFVLYTDIDRLERHMLELSPQDSGVIREFTRATRRLVNFRPPLGKPRELARPVDALAMIPGMLPVMGVLRKYTRMTVNEFTARFTDRFLGEALGAVFDLPDFPVLAIMMTMAYMHGRNAGYPVGGSQKFAQAIESRYLALGGEIHYRSRVAKILVENDRAVGIRLADGSEHRADTVISAADGHATLFEMLEGKYLTDEIRGYYETLPIFPPLVLVSLGVARDFSDRPPVVNYLLDAPVTIAGKARPRMGVKHMCYDPTLAPAGKSVLQVMFGSEYDYWKPMAADTERYEAEKKEIALRVMQELDRRFPGLSDQVEMVDVATPLTFERYTGNWQGSMEGWLITTKTMAFMTGKGMSKTLPGLEGFYMIGQWVEPGGGVPTGAMSARNVVQIICHRHGRPFTTRLADPG